MLHTLTFQDVPQRQRHIREYFGEKEINWGNCDGVCIYAAASMTSYDQWCV